MKCNVAPRDAAIRTVVGFSLIVSPLLNFHTYPYNLLGFIPLVTGLASYCPLYGVLGLLSPGQSRRSSTTKSHA